METELGAHVPFFQADAFTDRPFRGSPAAVFLTGSALDPTATQLLAREVSLSETVFVRPVAVRRSGDGRPLSHASPRGPRGERALRA